MRDRERALVRNASDASQVKRAARLEADGEEQKRARLQAVLQTPHGRAAMWDLLESAGVFRSIYHASALIHYNAGRQDFGHELMARLLEADEAGYLVMEQEARDRKRRANRNIDAATTAAATGGEDA